MIDLHKQDGVFVLQLRSGENRLNLPFVNELHAKLDEIEKSTEPTALVTVGEGKFYSNGLDLEWMGGPGREQAAHCVQRVHELLGRLLGFPMITVCALNGHTFAAGAMLAIAHDYRVMRDDRGYFCLPEVDIQIPFTPPMAALIQARLPSNAAHEAMVSGRRYTAEQARAAGIVHEVAPEQSVLPAALALAKAHVGKPRPVLGAIKQGMYRPVLDLLMKRG